jgi:hypothetical protein
MNRFKKHQREKETKRLKKLLDSGLVHDDDDLKRDPPLVVPAQKPANQD